MANSILSILVDFIRVSTINFIGLLWSYKHGFIHSMTSFREDLWTLNGHQTGFSVRALKLSKVTYLWICYLSYASGKQVNAWKFKLNEVKLRLQHGGRQYRKAWLGKTIRGLVSLYWKCKLRNWNKDWKIKCIGMRRLLWLGSPLPDFYRNVIF